MASFLERHSLAVAIAAVAVAALRIGAAYPETGLTWDEPAHVACGLEYLAQHVYRYETQHPPLARAMAAAGPYLEGVRPQGVADMYQEGVAMVYSKAHPGRTLTLMRLGILPFFFLACLVIHVWARHLFGNAVASLATALFTLLPPVLAHAGLATTDMALAACLSAAFLSLLLWAERPTWTRSLLLGAVTALALLSKFTTLGFLPAAAVLALMAHAAVERPTRQRLLTLAKERAPRFALAIAAGGLVIWAAYWFSFGKVPGWSISLPAPELFDGVRSAFQHNAGGHLEYFLGEVRRTGWWYYFPVVLAVKTPIAFLLLTGVGAWVCFAKRKQTVYWLPPAFSLGILLPSMTSHVNIGVRHILPVFAGFSIVAALGVSRLMAGRWTAIAAGVLVLWMAVSGALAHPDYLAYFNELAGDRPERILADSDLDWGQDTVRLARRLRQLGANGVSYTTLNLLDDRLRAWPGFPPVKPINPLKPAEGWTAVGPTLWLVRQYGLDHRYANLEPWFAYLKPVEKVGATYLYYVRPGSIPPELR